MEQRNKEKELYFKNYALDHASDPAFWTPLEDTRFIYVNDSAAELLGYTKEQLLQLGVPDIDPGYPRDRALSLFKRVKTSGKMVTESELLTRTGEMIPVEITHHYVKYESEQYTINFVRDISDRKKAEQVLMTIQEELEKRVEERTKELVMLNNRMEEAQRVAHFGTWEWNITDDKLFWSDELFRLIGVSPEGFEIDLDSYIDTFVHPDDRTRLLDAVKKSLETGLSIEIDYQIIRSDGEERTLHVNGKVLFDDSGAPVNLLGTAQDITKRYRTEMALRESEEQLRALTRRLHEVEEMQRKTFARELHDQVGQNLTALNINLNILNNSLPEKISEGKSRLTDSIKLVEDTTWKIRDLMAELRPQVLDDFGLFPALKWYASQFQDRTGIKTRVIARLDQPRLPEEHETILFRITQEALTNIAKHADARTVNVSLEESDESIRLTVTDDGTGFDLETIKEAGHLKGWGLINMQERADAIGGTFGIDSAPGKGTNVRVELRRQ